MKNKDLKRFYREHGEFDPKDFVRLGSDGKIDKDLLPDMSTPVLELTGVSGTLTDAQYALATGECVILLGTQYFRKAFSASTLLIYQAYTRQAGQDQALFEFVEITRSSKAWEYKSENIVEGNPTVPEGTEPTDLSYVRIGNTYFAIPQPGGAEHLYWHTLTLTFHLTGTSNIFECYAIILNDSSTSVDVTYIQNLLNSNAKIPVVTGHGFNANSQYCIPEVIMKSSNENNFYFMFANLSTSSSGDASVPFEYLTVVDAINQIY